MQDAQLRASTSCDGRRQPAGAPSKRPADLSVRDSYNDKDTQQQLPFINKNDKILKANSEARLTAFGQTQSARPGHEFALAKAMRTYQRGHLGENSVLTLMNGSTSEEKVKLKSMLN